MKYVLNCKTKKNIIKISIIILLVVFVSGLIYLIGSLQFILFKNGYDVTNFEEYKKFDRSPRSMNDSDNYKEVKIIKVYKKDGRFNFIEVAKDKKEFWVLLDEGEISTEGREYAVYNWMEYSFDDNIYDYDIFISNHKVIEIKKGSKEIQFSFGNLPEGISYIFSENDEFYSVEIFNTIDDTSSIPYNIKMNDIVKSSDN